MKTDYLKIKWNYYVLKILSFRPRSFSFIWMLFLGIVWFSRHIKHISIVMRLNGNLMNCTINVRAYIAEPKCSTGTSTIGDSDSFATASRANAGWNRGYLLSDP